MKTPYILLLSIAFSFLQTVHASDVILHSWTDNQGRTLQASFVKSDGTIVTIKWNGKDVPIPLATLSPESQSLAEKLAQAKNAAPSSAGMHSWTDTQGRTLQAIFIKADATTVTLNWNGRIVPIPLASLNAVSQKLAKDLSSAGSKPVAAPEPKPKPTLKPTIVDGELSLDAEHNWQSTDGNVITAKFISMEGEDVNLGLFSGRRESSVPLSRLSAESQALAKKLHGIYQQRKRLPCKLPRRESR